MSAERISCEAMERLISERGLCVVSSCTDLDAQFHSEPQIDTTWGLPDGTEVIRSYRYPSWDRGPGSTTRWADRKPCEHFLVAAPATQQDTE